MFSLRNKKNIKTFGLKNASYQELWGSALKGKDLLPMGSLSEGIKNHVDRVVYPGRVYPVPSTLLLLNMTCPVLANSVDPDQLASEEAN